MATEDTGGVPLPLPANVPDTGRHNAPPPITGPLFARHDLGVLIVAAVLLAAGVLVHARVTRPRLNTWDKGGVSVSYPAGWLAEPGGTDGVTFHGEDAITRLEIKISPRPSLAVNPEAVLELARARAYGGLYERLDTSRRNVGGVEILRTTYGYAFKPGDGHAPRVAYAVEYAYPADPAVPGDKIVVVTLHGAEERVAELEPSVLGSLRVPR